MSGRERGVYKQSGNICIPRIAIIAAISRCENISNPAVIDKPSFSVHVRKLPAIEGIGWVVRVIHKADFDKKIQNETRNYEPPAGHKEIADGNGKGNMDARDDGAINTDQEESD